MSKSTAPKMSFQAQDATAYLIPVGNYVATIIKADLKDAASGNSNFVAVQAKVQIDGSEHDGSVLFDNMTFQHPNPVAVRMGHAKLAQLCRAVHIENLDDAKDLQGCTCVVTIAIKKDAVYGDTNVITGYQAYEAPEIDV